MVPITENRPFRPNLSLSSASLQSHTRRLPTGARLAVERGQLLFGNLRGFAGEILT